MVCRFFSLKYLSGFCSLRMLDTLEFPTNGGIGSFLLTIYSICDTSSGFFLLLYELLDISYCTVLAFLLGAQPSKKKPNT